jgi:hypothetical protein
MINNDLFAKAAAAALAKVAASATKHAPHAERVAEQEAAVRAVGVEIVREKLVPRKRGAK